MGYQNNFAPAMGSDEEEEMRRSQMSGFNAPAAAATPGPSAATQAVAGAGGVAAGTMATTAATTALLATPLAPLAPILGPMAGSLVGSFTSSAIGGDGGGPQAVAPEFTGEKIKNTDTSVDTAGTMMTRGPMGPQGQADPAEFDEEEYMRRHGNQRRERRYYG